MALSARTVAALLDDEGFATSVDDSEWGYNSVARVNITVEINDNATTSRVLDLIEALRKVENGG